MTNSNLNSELLSIAGTLAWKYIEINCFVCNTDCNDDKQGALYASNKF